MSCEDRYSTKINGIDDYYSIKAWFCHTPVLSAFVLFILMVCDKSYDSYRTWAYTGFIIVAISVIWICVVSAKKHNLCGKRLQMLCYVLEALLGFGALVRYMSGFIDMLIDIIKGSESAKVFQQGTGVIVLVLMALMIIQCGIVYCTYHTIYFVRECRNNRV